MATVARPGRRPGLVFALVLGLLVGILVTAIVVPEHREPQELGGAEATAPVAQEGATGPEPAPAASGPTGQPAAPGSGSAPSSARESGSIDAGSPAGQAGRSAAPAPGPTPTTALPRPVVVRGVSDKLIKIGIGVPDLSVIAALGPGYDQGDLQAHAAAVLEGWKRDKKVPIHGRDVQFSYRRYNILDQTEQRAACVGLVQDAQVFIVIAVHNFQYGNQCVAGEFKTPVITTEAPTNDGSDEAYRRLPLLFTLQMSSTRMFRNWLHWAHRRNLLKGRTIGLYHSNDPVVSRNVDRDVKAELARLGYKVEVEATTDMTGAATGGPNDTIAMQRFRAGGVDLALLLVSSIAATNFMQQADAQAYKPQYIDNDLAFATTDTAASTKPTSQYGGTYAMTGMRFGEWKSGLGIPPPARACQANDARVNGRKVEPSERDAEWIAMNQVCDEAEIVLRALQAVGRNLTHQTFVAALETQIKNLPMGIHGNVTFATGKHNGVDQQRTIQFNGDCRCWKVVTPFSPLFV